MRTRVSEERGDGPAGEGGWSVRAGRFGLFVLILFLAAVASRAANEPKEAPSFRLQRFEGGGDVALSDFAGKIVVLDFFAHWCVPCLRASGELENKLRKPYQASGGNPQGVEVEVLSINVEEADRERTKAFIRRLALPLVVQDVDGATLKAYRGAGLPHLVIVDGTGVTEAGGMFRVVFRQTGFDGVEKLRAIIDRIGKPAPKAGAAVRPLGFEDWEELARTQLTAFREQGRLPSLVSVSGGREGSGTDLASVAAEVEAGGSEKEPEPRVIGVRASAAFEGAFATDIQLMQGQLGARWTLDRAEVSLSVSESAIGLDYRPVAFDFLGTPNRVDRLRTGVQAGARWRLLETVSLLGSVGYSDGFADYRSAWLSEYYRQQFGSLPGYAAPTPAGHVFGAGVRWEFLPATGFLQLDFNYLSDEIAPGYEIDFDGLRQGRPYLYTTVFRLGWEHVVHRRLRVLNEVRRIDTSDRELRLGYQGSANLALGERWTIRAQGGVTAEDPRFDAWYTGATVEYALSPAWTLSVTGRYYEDTGEIENSNFSNAAPELRSWQAGVGVRYATERLGVRLFAAPYATRFGDFGLGTAFFANLYRDRDWLLLQAACDFHF